MRMETNVRRDYKNSVFIDVFGRDEYQLQLFQTLHPEMTDVTTADITTITLKQVVTNHQYNDLAFLVRDKLMLFVEAQSTWSPNILIRILLYLADTLQEYIHDRSMDIHSETKLKLPEPEFYVIYTGMKAVPERITLCRDFFGNPNLRMDLQARVITAETQDIIGQYIIFCHVLDHQRRLHGYTREAVQEAIRICKDRGVLVRYLNEREKEVVNIMIMLFDQEYAVQQYVKSQVKEEVEAALAEVLTEGMEKGLEQGLEQGRKQGLEQGREEGREEGRAQGFLEALTKMVKLGIVSLKDGAEQANLPIDQFEALVANA